MSRSKVKVHKIPNRISWLVIACVICAQASAATVPTGTIETSVCPFEADRALLRVQCGRLTVPEDYDEPGRTIDIAFMIVHAQPNRDPGNPVLHLSGGPGSSSLAFVEMLTQNPHIRDVVVDRDWVFFDQRGLGRSKPALRCPDESNYVKRVVSCRNRLMGEGVDLSQYNSLRSAQDIEALRKALHVTRWNLWGTSYGSRLAFAVARDFPDSVRSIVHDGPSDPGQAEVINDFRGAEIAIEKLLSRCAVDVRCAADHPHLRTRFLAALRRLRAQPLVDGDRTIDDAGVASFIRAYLFNNAPEVIYRVRLRNLVAYMEAAARSDVAAMAAIRKAMPPDGTEDRVVPIEAQSVLGHTLSVECNEERSFETPEQYRLAAAQSVVVQALFGAHDGADFFQDCALWPAGRADPVRKSRVVYDGPQLAFSGEFDASLSGMSGYTIQMLYPNARNIVFRNAGHVQVDLTNFPPAIIDSYRRCALELARRFFANTDQPLDAVCAETRRLDLTPQATYGLPAAPPVSPAK